MSNNQMDRLRKIAIPPITVAGRKMFLVGPFATVEITEDRVASPLRKHQTIRTFIRKNVRVAMGLASDVPVDPLIQDALPSLYRFWWEEVPRPSNKAREAYQS